MTIIGIGTDITNIERIEKLITRFGDRFLNRTFTAGELAKANASPLHRTAILAKRFAAKEAASKALGTGFRGGVRFQHIEVSNDEIGKPTLIFHGIAEQKLSALAGEGRAVQAHLSLSDDHPFAQAFVVIESVSKS